MARYIDAEKLKTIIKNEYANAGSQGEHYAYDDCLSHIDGQPTADVVEVKRGYWKDRYGGKYANHLYECSVCGKKALYEIYSDKLQQTKTRQVLSNGCPHCFAKMDGGEAK